MRTGDRGGHPLIGYAPASALLRTTELFRKIKLSFN
jgi:hypothetical protein